MFKEGHCTEAERIYLHLVNGGFELGSTYCHLARVCIMLNRFEDAVRHTEAAEEHCDGHSYVRGARLFLRVVQCYLTQQSTGRLSQLRQTLAEPGVFEDWTMEPVIEYLKTNGRLTAAQTKILMTLIKVLSSVEDLPQMDTISGLDASGQTAS